MEIVSKLQILADENVAESCRKCEGIMINGGQVLKERKK